MNKLYISSKNYRKFFLTENTTLTMGNKERCGILVGKRLNEEDFSVDYVIQDINPIIQGKYKVVRSTKSVYPSLQKIINEDYNVDYIGEWHTHPFGPSQPSLCDLLTMENMINNPVYGNIDWAIMILITGYKKHHVLLFNGGKPQKMNLIIST